MKNLSLHISTVIILLLSQFQNLCGAGFLQVRNYTHNDYSGGPQNWAFAQDSIGRVYIGNRDGMLSFDGERWKKYLLSNATTVRSLEYVASESRMYAGGTDEFGYFTPASVTGKLEYISLKSTLPAKHPGFTEVWNIHHIGRHTYFQTDYLVLNYDGYHTEVIRSNERLSTSSKIGEAVYVGTETGSLFIIKENRFVALPGTESLKGIRIQSILPIGDNLLLCTQVNGLYLYDGKSAMHFSCDIDGFLKENQLFCGASDGKVFVFGTVARGAVVVDFSSGSARFANRQAGMLNNTVLSASFDSWGNIWLGLDNGLDYVLLRSAASTLIGDENDIGAGYTSKLNGNRLFLGTNQGLFSTSYPLRMGDRPLELSKELQGQIWSISDAGTGFFVAGDRGIFFHDGKSSYKINGTGGYRVRLLYDQSDKAIAACYDGYHLLDKPGNEWIDLGKIQGGDGITGDFFTDRNGNIWIKYWLRGLYRLKYDIESLRFTEVKFYDSKSGHPIVNGNSPTLYRGDIVITTEKGYYSWDKLTDRFKRHPQLNSMLRTAPSTTLHITDDNSLIVMDQRGIQMSYIDSSGNLEKRSVNLRGIRDKLVKGFEYVNALGAEEIILGTLNGFLLIDTSSDDIKGTQVMPFVNSVIANKDSMVYRAPFEMQRGVLSLPYKLSTLRFELGYPDYMAPEEIEFSVYLENYESDWDPYTRESVREYTHLSEGKYILHIRARNVNTDEIKESEFGFSISPPWYRSSLAKMVYFFLIISAIYIIIWFANRWKNRTKAELLRRKEAEMGELRRKQAQEALLKDYEIASLKSRELELDIKHKSGELSTVTMNLIRKNEFLNSLTALISTLQRHSDTTATTRKELENMKGLINENISNDVRWSDFSSNFDLVYNNYTKRLHEMYQNLTISDIRICCYIKMGLGSKDIAPLLNITVKSVEMARYRLRKKMGLAADVNLTEYLMNF